MNLRRSPVIGLPLLASLCAFPFSRVAAQSTVLYYEDFTDTVINTMGNLNNGTIVNGTAVLDDSTTTGRATFVVRWPVGTPLDNPIMTFQVDFTQPVDPYTAGTRMEVLLRAGVGTNNNTMSSDESVLEANAFRGLATDPTPSRLPLNDGSETLFMVYNNQETELTFASPVNGADVTLPAFNYVPYVLNRTTSTFSPLLQKGISRFNRPEDATPRDIIKVAIGSSTNTDIGRFAIDNFLIRSGVVFDRNFPSVGNAPGDFDGSGVVDATDFEVWQQRFGNATAPTTNGADFLAWQRNVVLPAAQVAASAVPEPAALAAASLAMVAVIGAARRRRAAGLH